MKRKRWFHVNIFGDKMQEMMEGKKKKKWWTRNDLEKVTIKKFPSIKILLDHFEMTSGCLISRMSGSGSTCFGLYEKKSEAVKAKNFLLQKFPKSWIKVAKILSWWSWYYTICKFLK